MNMYWNAMYLFISLAEDVVHIIALTYISFGSRIIQFLYPVDAYFNQQSIFLTDHWGASWFLLSEVWGPEEEICCILSVENCIGSMHWSCSCSGQALFPTGAGTCISTTA